MPMRPITPRPVFDAVLALVSGFMLALVLVVVREQMDPMLRTRAAVQTVLGAPVLGLIPHIRVPRRRMPRSAAKLKPPEPPFVPDAAPLPESLASTPPGSAVIRRRLTPEAVTRVADPKGRAAAAEAFARLHTNIQVGESGGIVKTVVITSPLTSEGKTTTATNLALSVAQRSQRVLLVDADLRRGAIHTAFGVDRAPGLTSVLQEQTPFEEAVHVFEVAGTAAPIHVLMSGPRVANPPALLASDAMRNLIRRTEARYDLVIIDSPPILAVGDAAILCGLVDGVVVVVRAGNTPRDALAYATEQLRMARAPIVGAILNDVDFRRATAYDSMFRYYGDPGAYAAVEGDEFMGSAR
jgi:capsular exopolysaccharide synthesis family protein